MRGKRRSRKVFLAGGILLAAALLLTGWNFFDDWRAGAEAAEVCTQLEQQLPQQEAGASGGQQAQTGEVEIPDYVLNPDMEMPTLEVEGNEYIGVLDIPVLGLSLPVLSEWSYPNLRVAPCRYSGSAYEGAFVLAGHNYRSHFGTLRELQPGDTLTFTDTLGDVFSYRVEEVEVLAPTDVAQMLDERWDLSLFTCTPSGQARVTVRCTKNTAL